MSSPQNPLRVTNTPRLALISGVARPSAALRHKLGRMVTQAEADKRIQGLLAEATCVDAMAALLTQAMEKCQTSDGRVDMKDVAAHVLKVMKGNQK